MTKDELEVGMIICRKNFCSRTILDIGEKMYFYKNIAGEATANISELGPWQPKKKTKTVEVFEWYYVNDGVVSICWNSKQMFPNFKKTGNSKMIEVEV